MRLTVQLLAKRAAATKAPTQAATKVATKASVTKKNGKIPKHPQGLQGLTSHSLSALLRLLGGAQSGRKVELVSRVENILRRPRVDASNGRPTRILSIDMGIRNLAYCVLEVKSVPTAPVKSARGTELDLSKVLAQLPSALGHVEVLHWKRLSLLDALTGPASASADEEGSIDANEVLAVDDAEHENINGDLRKAKGKGKTASKTAVTSTATSEATVSAPPALRKPNYSPLNVAKLAYKLVKDLFLPFDVTHVLIELQRSRSGGGAAVQEWTLRVNMLESMLHAVFGTFVQQHAENTRAARQKTAMPDIYSVNPKHVNGLWLEPVPEAGYSKSLEVQFIPELPAAIKGRTKGKITKERKIRLAEAWSRNDLHFSEAATRSQNRFLFARDFEGKRASTVRKANGDASAEGLTSEDRKVDDISDCLLQGIAWVQWELNRQVLQASLPPKNKMSDDVMIEMSTLDANALEAWPGNAPG